MMRYRPLTEKPWLCSAAHRELEPCPALCGVVRCFWGGENGAGEAPERIIPDTCADLIYHVDETTGEVTGVFCGVSDLCGSGNFQGTPGHLYTTFGIRFYAWTACLFAEDSLRGSCNLCENPAIRFGWLDAPLRRALPRLHTLEARAEMAQRLLLTHPLRKAELLFGVVGSIIDQRGTQPVTALAQTHFLSTRQLERLCAEHIGLSPKKLSELIRYQMIWQELQYRPCTVQELVERYGFADQAHLLREFKRYHGENLSHFFKTTPKKAGILISRR